MEAMKLARLICSYSMTMAEWKAKKLQMERPLDALSMSKHNMEFAKHVAWLPTIQLPDINYVAQGGEDYAPKVIKLYVESLEAPGYMPGVMADEFKAYLKRTKPRVNLVQLMERAEERYTEAFIVQQRQGRVGEKHREERFDQRPAKSLKCFECGKEGHKAADCFSKKKLERKEGKAVWKKHSEEDRSLEERKKEEEKTTPSAKSEGKVKSEKSEVESHSDEKCFKCGQTGHRKRECPNEKVHCDGRNCAKFGHTRETCYRNHPELKRKGKVEYVRDGETESESDTELEDEFGCIEEVFVVNEGKEHTNGIEGKIQGVNFDLIIDTGASRTVMTEAAFQRLKRNRDDLNVVKSQRVLVTPDGRDISAKKRIKNVLFEFEDIHFVADVEVILGEKERVLVGMVELKLHVPIEKIFQLETEDGGDDEEELPRPEEESVTEAAVKTMLEHLCNLNKLPEEKGVSKQLSESIGKLVVEYRHLFATGLQACPAAKVLPYSIEVIEEVGERPVKARIPFRSTRQEESLFKEISSMVKLGVMRKAVKRARNWTSPIISLKKPDGDYRHVLNLKLANERTKVLSEGLPRIDELHASIPPSAKWFGKLDMRKGYWLVPLTDEACMRFGVSTSKGVYEFTRMPMGSVNAAGHFQRIMEEMFGEVKNVLYYQDDLLLWGENEEDYLETLRSVFKILSNHDLRLNPDKVTLAAREVVFCGSLVSHKGISVDPERISGLLRLEKPTRASELQNLLCSASWIRKHIPDFARIVAPLQERLKAITRENGTQRQSALKRIKLDLNIEESKALEALKTALINSITLARPRKDMDTILMTDASDSHYSIMISQTAKEEREMPVHERAHAPLMFISGGFKENQVRWHTIDKELFPIYAACKKFQCLLETERPIEIYSDNNSVVKLLEKVEAIMERNVTNDRRERWLSVIRSYRYKAKHIKGDDNQWCDMLTRWAVGNRSSKIAAHDGVVLALEELENECVEWEDREFNDVFMLEEPGSIVPSVNTIAKAGREELKKEPGLASMLLIPEDVEKPILMNGRIWLPESDEKTRMKLIAMAHGGQDGPHLSGKRTWKELSSVFEGTGLKELCRKVTDGCLRCMKAFNQFSIPRPLGEQITGHWPNEAICLDYLTMPPSKTTEGGQANYILVMKDMFSHFVSLKVCKTADAVETAMLMAEWISGYGTPDWMITDNGSHFKNQLIESLVKTQGLNSHFTTVYHPQSNGAAEIVNKQILECVRQMAIQTEVHQKNWPVFVKNIQSFMNTQEADSLGGASPMEVFLGRKPKKELEWWFKEKSVNSETGRVSRKAEIENAIKEAHAEFEERNKKITRIQALIRRRQTRLSQGRRRLEELEIGDLVLAAFPWKYSDKTMARWKGPFKLIKVLGPMRYVIQSLYSSKEVEMSADHIRKFRSKDCPLLDAWKKVVEYEEKGFTPKRICSFIIKDGMMLAEVVWSGRNAKSWEMLDSLLEDHLSKSVAAMREWIEKGGDSEVKKRLELKLQEMGLSSVGGVDAQCSLQRLFA
jgi:hypothetical protein